MKANKGRINFHFKYLLTMKLLQGVGLVCKILKGGYSMKKVLSFALGIVLCFGLISLAAATDESTAETTNLGYLEELSEEELLEIRDKADELLMEIRKEKASGEDDDEPVEATRADPALVGQTVICSASPYSNEGKLAIQIVRSMRGEAANALLKSFNKYNTRLLDKGQEWYAVMFKFEALESDEDKIDLNDYYFHFVSNDGIEYTDRYVSGNPAEIKSMYVGATQYAWFASKVKKDDATPFITYDRASETAWFNPNERIIVDTSNRPYDTLKNKDEGKDVEEMQYRLMEYGLYTSAPSGKYDKATTTAVKAFQKAFGIDQSGTADEGTLRVLYSGKSMPQ